jgi:hypothetical protein
VRSSWVVFVRSMRVRIVAGVFAGVDFGGMVAYGGGDFDFWSESW